MPFVAAEIGVSEFVDEDENEAGAVGHAVEIARLLDRGKSSLRRASPPLNADLRPDFDNHQIFAQLHWSRVHLPHRRKQI